MKIINPFTFGRRGLAYLWMASLAGVMGSWPARSADPPANSRQPVKLSEEALRIHREALVIDGHNDLPWQFREKKDLSFERIDIAKPQKGLQTDIPRLRQGGIGAQFWAA